MQNHRTSPWLDALTTALGPVIWGSTYIVTTELLPPDRPFTAALLRTLPAGLLLGLWCRVHGQDALGGGRPWGERSPLAGAPRAAGTPSGVPRFRVPAERPFGPAALAFGERHTHF